MSIAAPTTAPAPASRDSLVDCIVIGTGPSGLVAMKELRDHGLSVLAFEAQADVGGVFRSSYDFLRPSPAATTSSSARSRTATSRGRSSGTGSSIMLPVAVRRAFRPDRAHPLLDAGHRRAPYRRRRLSVDTGDGGVASVPARGGLLRCVHRPQGVQRAGSGTFKGEVMHSPRSRTAAAWPAGASCSSASARARSDISLEVAKHAAATCISSRGGPGTSSPVTSPAPSPTSTPIAATTGCRSRCSGAGRSG